MAKRPVTTHVRILVGCATPAAEQGRPAKPTSIARSVRHPSRPRTPGVA
jgi:hypothetical protein